MDCPMAAVCLGHPEQVPCAQACGLAHLKTLKQACDNRHLTKLMYKGPNITEEPPTAIMMGNASAACTAAVRSTATY